jgi:DNA-binding transcriptional LysR family regulator
MISMDRLDCMRTFVAAVRAGGFSAVARSLDLPRSKVSKPIQALEAMLGVQLLVRTTRSLRLTEAGSRYHAAALDVQAALDAAEEDARDVGGGLKGVLRLNAPVSFGVRVLARLLPLFHARHPEIELQVALSDQLVDPVRGGFDLTLRIADLKDSSLVARQLMPAPRRLVAAPALLTRHGVPKQPKDLARWPVLNYGLQQGGATIAFSRGRSIQRVHARGPLLADNGDLLALAAEAGMGVALLPDFITADALAAGRLVTVLDDWLAPPIAVHALFPAARHLPRRTRALLDFLVETLAPRLR